MVIDTLEQLKAYANLNPLFGEVVAFLESHDLNTMECGKYPQKNIVYVSHNYDNSKVTEFYVLDLNWLTVDMIDWWFHKACGGTGDPNFICNVTFKVRHSPERYTGKMYFYGSDKNIKIVSDTPVTAAPGQFCILYDDKYSHCYGCGEMLTKTNIMNRI